MKFDLAIGKTRQYQDEMEGTSDNPVYNLFGGMPYIPWHQWQNLLHPPDFYSTL